jgi:UDP-N-acetylmuramyl pentapeptide phosphotransferase/UDP-N-acetylglucosamine-1-phosphate transferase
MIVILKLLFGLILHKFINFILLRSNTLLDDPNYFAHKKMTNNRSDVVLSGGIVFFLLFMVNLDSENNLTPFLFLILLVGLMSDLKILDLPILRFFLQFLIIIIFVYQFKLSITSTDLKYLDFILDYKLVSLFFTVICFLVLINGSNFLDGLNGLVLVYYILVLLSLIFLVKNNNLDYDLNLIFNVLLILFILLIFNLFNESFLGDSGAYLISSIVGYIAIDFYNSNENFSVLLIVVILWYPAFETLYSIIRKIINKISPISPDNKHLHQNLYNYINLKTKKIFFSNILSACLINCFNAVIFLIAVLNFRNSIILSLILFLNVISYIYLYIKLEHEK